MALHDEPFEDDNKASMTAKKGSGENWGCVVLVLGVIFLLMLPSIIEAIDKLT